MSEPARQTAERVVNRLLDGETVVQEFSSHEEFEQRPGGPKDPYRQTTVPIHFPRGSFTGKRSGMKKVEAPDVLDPEDLKDKPTHPRWSWKPSAQHECTSKVGTPSKAWKQARGQKGKPIASKPGKLSYKEALMRQVIENIRVKRAMKMGKAASGKSVARKPGKVSYRSEAKMAIKGLGKKKPAAVASAPGKVRSGKR
jgi:hypothetical protein